MVDAPLHSTNGTGETAANMPAGVESCIALPCVARLVPVVLTEDLMAQKETKERLRLMEDKLDRFLENQTVELVNSHYLKLITGTQENRKLNVVYCPFYVFSVQFLCRYRCRMKKLIWTTIYLSRL